MMMIDVYALTAWLKKIPMKDLSDGKGLCRVIFESDFSKAIHDMPKGCIVDAVPVIRCKDCVHRRKDDGFCKVMNGFCGDDSFFCASGIREDNT